MNVLISATFLLSLVITWLLIPRIIKFAFSKQLFDKPSERKIHHGSVPRLGGLTFFPVSIFSIGVVVAVFTLLAPTSALAFWIAPDWVDKHYVRLLLALCAAMILYVFGVADDLNGVRYRNKFLAQIVAGLLMCLSGVWLDNLQGIFGLNELSPWVGWPITVFAIVFITNAINFIDGIDGLASGLCSIGLVYYGCTLSLYGKGGYALLAFSALGAVLAFMWYNLHGTAEKKNKIFMGDTGSLSIGFLLAFLGLKLVMKNSSVLQSSSDELLLAFTLLLVPTFDVFRVSLLRMRNHYSPLRADKNHIHHKLLRLGLTPHVTLITILCLALAFLAINFLMYQFTNITVIVITDIAIYSLFHLFINYSIKKKGGSAHVF